MSLLKRGVLFVACTAIAGALLALPTQQSAAQNISTNYTFSSNSGTFTPVTGGTVWGTTTNDDNNFTGIPIGFNFNFNGVVMTTVGIQTNGWIAFGGTVTSSYTPISSGTYKAASALANDLQGQSGTYNSELSSITLGTAPNRVFVVQWLEYRRYGATGDRLNFQIRLYETTNRIEVVYGLCQLATSASQTFQVGLRGINSADFNNLAVSSGTNTWATPTAGTVNSATCQIQAATFCPNPGQTYVWDLTTIPPPPPTVAGIKFQHRTRGYAPITGGTVLGTNTNDDNVFNTTPLGFTFKFLGTNYTSVGVCANGWIGFSTSISSTYTPISGGSVPCIAGLARDIQGNGSSSELSYQTQGSAPFRIFILQWKEYKRYGTTGTGDVLNFQIRMYETSNNIEVCFGDMTLGATNTSSNTFEIGLRGLDVADFNNRSVLSGVNTWATSVPGTIASAYCTMAPGLLPANTQTYFWGCYVPDNAVTAFLCDETGASTTYSHTPGPLFINYTIAPTSLNADILVTARLYRIGDPTNSVVYSGTFMINAPAGVGATGITQLSLPSLPQAWYRVELTFNTRNSCDLYEDAVKNLSTLLVSPTTELCLVWPGDVNNDGVVNYGDRSALARYIFDANLSPTWLQGPARYRADAQTNPLAYYTWEAQASIPWQTQQGCYMDADGNGVVNTYDMMPIKVNWFRTHGAAIPKSGSESLVSTFGLEQNWPNPFNPTTTLAFSAPEHSSVRLVVTDMTGREISVLVDGDVSAGRHAAVFDASRLASGVYLATVHMTGVSGATFSRTIPMTLGK